MGGLNARQITLVRFLLNVRQTTAGELAKRVGVSEKTIYSDLQIIKLVLERYDVQLDRQPRIGITVKGNIENPQEIINDISKNHEVPDSDQERVTYILTQLLKTNSFLTVEQLAQQLFISPKAIERNLKQLETKIAGLGVSLERHPKKGVRLLATEPQKRKVLFNLLNSFWGNRWIIRPGKTEQVMSYQQITDGSLISSQMAEKLIVIVTEFVKKQNIKISDYAFQSLVIHLAIAVQRVEDGNAISKKIQSFANLGDIQKENAIILADLIQQKLKIILPNEEIGYIQLHLIAAASGVMNIQVKDKVSPVKKRLKILLKDFGMDNELLAGLTVHLESALKRLQVGATISNPYTNTIKQNYTQAFDEALKIAKSYETHEQIEMNDDEVAYLAIYLEAFLERKRVNSDKIRVAIVCSTGLGSAQLLAAKVRKEFSDLQICGVWSIQDLQEHSLEDVDLIISTIQIKIEQVPTVVVSPLLEDEELSSIKLAVEHSQKLKTKVNLDFKNLIFPDLVYIDKVFSDWKAIIRFITEQLEKHNFAVSGVEQSAIQRENLSYTSFGNYAVPHANPELIKKPAIVVCTLKKPIQWGDQSVSIIFFMAMTKTFEQKQIDNIFDDFYDLVSDKRRLEKLLNSKTSEELYSKMIDKER